MDNRPMVNMRDVVHIDPGHAIITCVSREINGEFRSVFLLYESPLRREPGVGIPGEYWKDAPELSQVFGIKFDNAAHILSHMKAVQATLEFMYKRALLYENAHKKSSMKESVVDQVKGQ